jgi:hypothetical protein
MSERKVDRRVEMPNTRVRILRKIVKLESVRIESVQDAIDLSYLIDVAARAAQKLNLPHESIMLRAIRKLVDSKAAVDNDPEDGGSLSPAGYWS